jgi:hypothetical protein
MAAGQHWGNIREQKTPTGRNTGWQKKSENCLHISQVASDRERERNKKKGGAVISKISRRGRQCSRPSYRWLGRWHIRPRKVIGSL